MNGIDFDGGADDDNIILGEGALTFTGVYTPSGPEAGNLSYTSGADTQSLDFADVEELQDATLASTLDVDVNGVSSQINVEDGGILDPVASLVQGPVVVDGGDRDDHGSFSASATIGVPQNVDAAGWNAGSTGLAPDGALPTTSISGTGDGSFDFYEFAVPAGPNVTVELEIVAGNFDTELFLYDQLENVITQNDDGGAGTLSRITTTLTAGQTYIVGVGRFNSSAVAGGAAGAPPQVGNTYTLEISVPGHALTGGGRRGGGRAEQWAKRYAESKWVVVY